MAISTFLLASLATTSLAAVVHMPINKHAAPAARGFTTRQSSAAANVAMSSVTQFQFQLGTPPQDLIWGIDTGSYFAVVSEQASGGPCADATDPVCFDHTKSSTWVQQPGSCGEGFLGGGINGDDTVNGTETFIVGGIQVDNVPVCYNTGAGDVAGIVGLSMSDSQYPYLLQGLRDGHIDRAATAIWLNDLGRDDGEITFGGVDASRATSGFTQMTWHPEVDGTYTNLRAPFTSFGLVDADGQSHSLTPQDYPGRAPALDTGDPGISLPVDLYNALWAALGVVNSTSTGLKAIPCDLTNSPAKLTFEFGGSFLVETPMSTWVGQQFDEPIILPNGTAVPACQLHIDADPGDNGLLGQPLIQYLYNVWDYENKDIFMAHASQGVPSEPSVTPIPSGTGIPGVTATATVTGSVVTTGKVIQTEPQVTTVVRGTTGLVYSTPAFVLDAGNPEPTAA